MTEIHEIVFYGKGGYDWNTIYNMPISLRRFIYNKIKEFYEKQNAEQAASNNQINPNSKELISRPNINPTYSTKKAP